MNHVVPSAKPGGKDRMTIIEVAEKLGRVVDSSLRLIAENIMLFLLVGVSWGMSQCAFWILVSMLEDPNLSVSASALLVLVASFMIWGNVWSFLLCARPSKKSPSLLFLGAEDGLRTIFTLGVASLFVMLLLSLLVVPIVLSWGAMSFFVEEQSRLAWFSASLAPIFVLFLATTTYLVLRFVLFWPLMSFCKPQFRSVYLLAKKAWQCSRSNLRFFAGLSALHGSLLCVAFAVGALLVDHPSFRPEVAGQMEAVWPQLFRSQCLSVGLGCLFMQPALAFAGACWQRVVALMDQRAENC